MNRKRLNICLLLLAAVLSAGVLTCMTARTPHRVHTIKGGTHRGQHGSSFSTGNGSSTVTTYTDPGQVRTVISANGSTYEISQGGDSVYVIRGNGIRKGRMSQASARSKRTGQGLTFDNDDSVYEDDPGATERYGGKTRRIIKGIGKFHALKASRSIRIIYTQGKPGDITVEGPEMFVRALEVENQDGNLELSLNCRSVNTGATGYTVTVTCSSPGLSEVELQSAASLEVKGRLTVKGRINIDVSSASSVSIGELDCAMLLVDGSSAGSVRIPCVTAGELVIDTSSASSFTTSRISASGNVTLDASSASGITADVIECRSLLIDAGSASSVNVGTIRAAEAAIDVSSAAKCNIKGSIDVGKGRLQCTASSTATVEIGALQSIELQLGATSQSSLRIYGVNTTELRLDVQQSRVTLRGHGRRAFIEAGSTARVEAAEFDVDEATVEAGRYAEVAIKAAKINY